MHEVDNKVANEEPFDLYEGSVDNEALNDEENESDDASNDEEKESDDDEDYEIQNMELLDDEVSEEDEEEYIDEDIDEELNQENSDKIADKALSFEQMPPINGEFAPYFKNVTEALTFCWIQKHNICKFKFDLLYSYLLYITSSYSTSIFII